IERDISLENIIQEYENKDNGWWCEKKESSKIGSIESTGSIQSDLSERPYRLIDRYSYYSSHSSRSSRFIDRYERQSSKKSLPVTSSAMKEIKSNRPKTTTDAYIPSHLEESMEREKNMFSDEETSTIMAGSK